MVQRLRRLRDKQETDGSIPSVITETTRSVSVAAARVCGMDEDRVQFPDGPLIQMGWHVPRGRQILARSVRRVRFPCGPLSFRKVAGYGLPGRFAKPCDFLSHVGSNPMPSAFAKRLDGETDIMSRFEREVPGSNPGRAAVDIRKGNPIGEGNRFEPG